MLDQIMWTRLTVAIVFVLYILKQLDIKILDLTEEGSLADQIELADTFTEGIYVALVDIDKCCVAPPIPMPLAAVLTPGTGPAYTA